MRINDALSIDERFLEERYARASGPGGQHVNTTESAVQLRYDLASDPALAEPVRRRLARLAGARLTKDGVIVITADRERARERNREAARERLKALILKALEKPKPRIRTRPSASSIRRQKEAKAKRAQTKALRKPPKGEA
jgi:ribosome-associated protein